MIRGLTAPYARASAQIERAAAEVVIVDDLGLAYARDLVRNDPFLRNAPKVMWLGDLDDAQIRVLCRRYSVSIFEAAHGKAAGIAVVDRRRAPALADIFDRRRALMTSMECGAPLPLPSR